MKTLNSLVVRVDEIPPEGQELELDIPPSDLTDLVTEDGEETPVILSPLTGTLKLRLLGGDRLSIKGSFQVKAELTCDRCLTETAGDLASDVQEVLNLVAPGEVSSENEEDESDGSLEVVDGKINLSSLLGELFWLAWPWRFLCKSDCAGLCPNCGTDLNEGLCGCVEDCGNG